MCVSVCEHIVALYPYPYKTHLTYSNGNHFRRLGLSSSMYIYVLVISKGKKKKFRHIIPISISVQQLLNELLGTYGSGHSIVPYLFIYSILMA